MERRRVTVEGTMTGRIPSSTPARGNTPKAGEPANEPALHVKYRPRALKDVLGQGPSVRSLEDVLRAKARPHCYLFTGPSGCGKTTLARILAAEFRCDPSGLIEVDAASKSGVDDVRALTEPLHYLGFGALPNKGIIIDECHRLSKNAWDAFLKVTEDCPAHVFFFFCSTEPDKVPKAMVTRSVTYALRPVPFDDLVDLLEDVAKDEGYDCSQKMLQMVAQAAEGSPRAALTMLAKVHGLTDTGDIQSLLQRADDDPELIDLCRAMVRGGEDFTWPRVCAVLKAMDLPAESVRIMVANYLSSCALNARSDKEATRILDMLEPFLRPCNQGENLAPVVAAFGRAVFP